MSLMLGNALIIALEIITTAVYTIAIGVPVIIMSFFSRTGKTPYQCARAWAWLMVKTNRIRIHVEGDRKLSTDSSYIFIANHSSNLDPPIVAYSIRNTLRFVAKKSLAKIPFFGFAIRRARMIMIDRDDTKSSREALDRVVGDLHGGVSALFFAEGTRSPDGRLQRFKKGGVMLAIKARLPIVPITITGSHRLMPKRSLRIKPGVVKVIIGDPVDTSPFTEDDRDILTEKIRSIISANLEREAMSGSCRS